MIKNKKLLFAFGLAILGASVFTIGRIRTRDTQVLEFKEPGFSYYVIPNGVTSIYLMGVGAGAAGGDGLGSCGEGCPGSGGYGGVGNQLQHQPELDSAGREVPIAVNPGVKLKIYVGAGGTSPASGVGQASYVQLIYGASGTSPGTPGNLYLFGNLAKYSNYGGGGADRGNQQSQPGRPSGQGGSGGQSFGGNQAQNWGGYGGGGGAGYGGRGGNGGRGGFDWGSRDAYNGNISDPEFIRLHNGQPGGDAGGRIGAGGGGGGGGGDNHSIGGHGGSGGPGYVQIHF